VRSVLCAVLLLVVACGEREVQGTACTTDKDCNLFNAQGTCESTGYCSYPDATCLSGQRYAPGAGDSLSNTCLGDNTCGGKDQACCSPTTCGSNLVCVMAGAAFTCQCGTDGQPCCDGTTCSGTLRCGDGNLCSSDKILDVSVSAGHTCALTSDGAVWCWGYDYKAFGNRGGLGTTVVGNGEPAPVGNVSGITQLRGGEFHACGRTMDGSLWCWGHNGMGQLGDGTTTSTASAVRVSGLSNVTQFDAGKQHTCALGTVNGTTTLYCWGRGGVKDRNNATQDGSRLGNGSVADSSVPVAVDLAAATAGGATVKQFSTGNYHSCVVMSDDTVWCWGRNDDGQLGDGTTTSSLVPVQVDLSAVTIGAGVTVDEVSCSDGRPKNGNTCIRLSDGAVYCWGWNDFGQLGDGSTTSHATPDGTLPLVTIDLAGAKPVELVSGQRGRCARMDTNEVWCWGENRGGLIGNNGTVDDPFPTPQKVVGLTGVKRLEMSHHTACAIDGADHLFCWGANRRGNASGKLPATFAEQSVMMPVRVTL